MADVETNSPVEDYSGQSSPARLVEIARYFLFIGIVGFGGPLVHIAMMEDDLVGEDSREWTNESIFMEGLAICNMLPGPASTQLGIFMGWIRAGNPGAIVAGFFFMLPTFILVVFFSWLYFAYQTLPAVEAAFYGINPVVIGLIVGAAYSMAQSALADGKSHAEFEIGSDTWSVDFLLVALLVAAIVVTATLNPNPVLEFIVAGLIAVVLYRSDWVRTNVKQIAATGVVTAIFGGLYAFRSRVLDLVGPRIRTAIEASPLWGLALTLWANPWVKLFLFMIYTGSFIYGGGLVLIPFIEKYVVNEFAWLTAREFVDGIAIGQLSPGPVVMTTAFVGYKLLLDVSGGVLWIAILGALVATVGAFGPSFVFIMGFFPYFARVRENDIIQTALIGVNAAVVGAILGATVTLAAESFVDVFTVALAVVTFGLFVRGTHAAYLILGGGGVGMAWYFLIL
ncbi:chromate efflux transporter [Halorubrum tebenquichense]|uniref:Chromate transport protein n=1 Tax=Halorubrum tebenquichense DSM 14210 TaxID=1227485 RepID=M0DFF8_9EURY|nr:chromate efflux transporter [Halorubrum tebenquichense]ELZ32904.1 chromate transport protein [Halorubrum tebenquichense DSM 14210]